MGPRETSLLMWLSLVTVLSITGSPSRSESSNPTRVRSFASWGLLGSRTGTQFCFASQRLSCSVRLLCWEGSSVEMKTSPAFTPLRLTGFRTSRATLRPTCFMATMLLWLHMEAP